MLKLAGFLFPPQWSSPSPPLSYADQAALLIERGLVVSDPNVRGTGRTSGARTLGDGKSLMFPMRSGKPISMSTLRKMLRHHRIAAVAHGFRSSLRDWAAEETDHPREVIRRRWRTCPPTQRGKLFIWNTLHYVFRWRFPCCTPQSEWDCAAPRTPAADRSGSEVCRLSEQQIRRQPRTPAPDQSGGLSHRSPPTTPSPSPLGASAPQSPQEVKT